MGYCQQQCFEETYHVPEGFRLVSTPKPIKLETPWMTYETSVDRKDNRLTVARTLTIKSTIVPRDHYDEFRRFCIALDEYEAQVLVFRRAAD